MSDELSGGPDTPSGLEPGEKVPNELRILASGESLGVLRSVHRPATRMARFALRSARVYRYDRGLVMANGRGGLGLYRYDQITVLERGGSWFVHRADDVLLRLTKHWTGIEELGRAVEQGAARAAGEAKAAGADAGKAAGTDAAKAAEAGKAGTE
ncbi:MAG TPA: hypothetical protein VH372_06885 [Actinospica sp.]|jgi:hypothetical protein|nr:hypothetical protein [Actinospica sp.]